MGGPNLEVAKVCDSIQWPKVFSKVVSATLTSRPSQFGMYIFFPIGWMYYFGTNLDQRFAVPDFWPKREETNQIPYEREDIQAELARLKAKRLAGRERRLEMERMQGSQAVEEGVKEGVIGESVKREGGFGGESAYLKTLGNAEHTEARAPAVNVEEKQQGGKGWFHFW